MALAVIRRLLTTRSWFNPRPIRTGFVVGRVALVWIFSPVLRLAPVSVIQLMLHNHLHVHVAVSRRTKEGSLETFHKTILLVRKLRSIGYRNA
jgi:hypothetical protein